MLLAEITVEGWITAAGILIGSVVVVGVADASDVEAACAVLAAVAVGVD